MLIGEAGGYKVGMQSKLGKKGVELKKKVGFMRETHAIPCTSWSDH